VWLLFQDHDQWQKVELDLAAYSQRGILQLRLNAVTGAGMAGDIGEFAIPRGYAYVLS